MASLVQSDFTESAASGSTITWTGGKIAISRPSSQYASSYAYTNTTYNSGIIIGQAYMYFGAGGGIDDFCHMMLTSSALTSTYANAVPYAAKCGSRTSTSSKFRLDAGAATWNSYELESSVTCGVDVKITYDTSNNNIKYWYWGGSAWTQFGTTQTYDIKNGGNVKFAVQNTNVFTDVAPYWQDMYFGTYAADYSTHYPVTAAANSGFFCLF